MESKAKKTSKKQPKAPQFTFLQFCERYPNDDICLDEMFDRKAASLATCPDCERETKYHRVKSRKCYECQFCGHQVYPLAGTIFQKSTTPLRKWFFAIYLFSVSKNGVSAKELQRQLGVTYKTAFRIGHKIRTLMDEGKDIFMTGTVEVDESLFGGKKRGGKRGWGSENKTCVFGMVDRDGQIRTTPVPDRKAKTIIPIIVEHVDEEATVYSDEFKGYNKLNREVKHHDTVCHGKYEWVRGDVHTQTIEGAWSLRKRSIKGTYTSVSPKYLQNYLSEFDFRHNHRSGHMFNAIISNI